MNCVNALTGAKIRPVYTVQLSASKKASSRGKCRTKYPGLGFRTISETALGNECVARS